VDVMLLAARRDENVIQKNWNSGSSRITNYAHELNRELDCGMSGWPEKVRTHAAELDRRERRCTGGFTVEGHAGKKISVFTHAH